jgi:Apoptosis inhibitory protein 5 (API5)
VLSSVGTLLGIFSNILKDNDLIRERAIQFIVNKLRVISSEEVLTKDVEEEFIAQCRKVIMVDSCRHYSFVYDFRSLSALVG